MVFLFVGEEYGGVSGVHEVDGWLFGLDIERFGVELEEVFEHFDNCLVLDHLLFKCEFKYNASIITNCYYSNLQNTEIHLMDRVSVNLMNDS